MTPDVYTGSSPQIVFHSAFRYLLIMLLGSLQLMTASQAASRELVELRMPSGVVATARYQRGSEPRAVLLLHGLLQTSGYLTVSNLITGLTEQGYTVLAPTLSLGVDQRRASLECGAIHDHSLAEDVAEIQTWVAWLESRGHNDIALLGHSFGSLQLVAYAAGQIPDSVSQLIATSLVDQEHQIGDEEYLQQLQQARQLVAQGDRQLHDYRLSYCKRYVAPAGAFLSYAEWTREHLLSTLADLKLRPRLILGSADARMHPDWPSRLRSEGVEVVSIDGAGHFFDSQFEFDLLDEVVAMLQSDPKGR